MAKKRATKKKATKRKATGRKTAKKRTTKKAGRKRAATKKRATKATRKKTTRKATKKRATKATKKAKKRTTKRKTAKKKTKRKPNPAFMRPLTPSSALAAVIGSKAIPRTKVVQKLWEYIKSNNLQDSEDRRHINADAKLKPIFGKKSVSMLEMPKLINKHLS